MKKTLSILLSFLLVLSVPLFVFAEPVEYGLYVNGEQFTSEKTSIVCGEGTADFDGNTNTLTLTNATIDNVFGDQYGVINSSLKDLTIVLVGANTLDGKSNNDGIDADGGCNITITGEGTLDFVDTYYGTYIGYYDTEGADLTIKDTTVTVTDSACAGLWVNHDINFINSSVTITRTGSNYNGIVSNVGGTITVDGGTVSVTNQKAAVHMGNTDDSQHALVINSGDLSLTSVEAEGVYVQPVGTTEEINATLTVNGGKLEISSATVTTNIPEDKITLAETVSITSGGWTEASVVCEASEAPPVPINFPDVHEGDWFYDAVQYCAQKGFITGYKNGNFGPADALQRQDFVVILARIAGADIDSYTSCKLKDVDMNAYYGKAVAWAVDQKIIGGYDNGKFGVGDKITREQVATILYRYMDSPDVDTSVLNKFADKGSISSFAVNAIAWANANGVINGKTATTLAPTATASRAEIATIIMRMDQQGMFA